MKRTPLKRKTPMRRVSVRKQQNKLPKTLSGLKKELWTLFSIFIRCRDADKNGIVRCCTCPKTGHWTTFQAGHFIDGRGNSILFEPSGVHAQCMACNVFKHGNKIEYYEFMKQRYGQEKIDTLRTLSKQPRFLTREWYYNEINALTEIVGGPIQKR